MTPNSSRRKTVMSRSIKLGHCVCNPKKPCPCDIFKEYNVCQCAGEKLPTKPSAAALTQHVRKAGCASKIGQADLLRILSNLPPVTDPNVLLGTAAGDDAGIYRIGEHQALVQTVDVFTPCVDDPYLFGQIAAANSVSDVYAMGGRPVSALSIVGFPMDELDDAMMTEMLRGGIDKLEEAGCSLIGGHSINDEEVKLGFAVTGLIDPDAAVRRDCARPGDVLVLTKPLGTGMVCFAAQIGRVTQACLAEVGSAMATLNRDAAELMAEHGVHACTDVTGYGLAGHLSEMVRNSGVTAEIDLSMVPVFSAAAKCLAQDIIPGAIERNQEYSMGWVHSAAGEPDDALAILYDPQTSGGLLLALPAEHADGFVQDMLRRGHSATSVIGRIVASAAAAGAGRIEVINCKLRNLVGTEGAGAMAEDRERDTCCEQSGASAVPAEPACCSGATASGRADSDDAATGTCCDSSVPAGDTATPDRLAVFQEFMKEANQPGLIDRRNKKLMAIVLSISQRCRPCLAIHLKGALAMGITQAEIDEAAALAVAFGGCPAMMFYKEVLEEVFTG